MKKETILLNIKEYLNKQDIVKFLQFVEKLEQDIRQETCYKTTSKTRVNAIKKVASKCEARPALTGYAIQEINGETYRVVTDSYHLVAIKQDEMPLPLVATKEQLEELGIDYKEYKEKYGNTSILNLNYPHIQNLIPSDFYNYKELDVDVEDVNVFNKTHKFDKTKKTEDLYKIEDATVNPQLLMNVINVLGKDIKCYYLSDTTPIYFKNKDNELGLVLPIKEY